MYSSATNLTETRTDTLLLGYGNTLRGDDGVGPAVVEQIRQRLGGRVGQAVICRCEFQLTPELASAVAASGRVIFVDASVELPAGRVELKRVEPGRSAAALGHQFSPAQLLQMTQCVFGVAPRAWVAAIGAESLQIGEGLSPAVSRAAARLVDHLVYHLARRAGMGRGQNRAPRPAMGNI